MRGVSRGHQSIFVVWNLLSYTTGREYRSEYNRYLTGLDITIHVIAPQLSSHCDVINNRMWRHQQNEDRVNETPGRCVKIVVLLSFMDSSSRVRNKIMYLLSWRTISALTRMLFLYQFRSLLRNSGNKLQSNPLESTKTVRHSSTYIMLSVSCFKFNWNLISFQE